MSSAPRHGRQPLVRADLPEQFTPDSVRRLGFGTARRLSQPGNGVLSPDEQVAFDRALREAMQGTADRLDQTMRRFRGGGHEDLDPDLRRSYARTRQRLAAQAKRAQENFPQLTSGWAPNDVPAHVESPLPDATEDQPDVSLETFESEVEQTSDMLEMLDGSQRSSSSSWSTNDHRGCATCGVCSLRCSCRSR